MDEMTEEKARQIVSTQEREWNHSQRNPRQTVASEAEYTFAKGFLKGFEAGQKEERERILKLVDGFTYGPRLSQIPGDLHKAITGDTHAQ